jgi:hypothetical protein
MAHSIAKRNLVKGALLFMQPFYDIHIPSIKKTFAVATIQMGDLHIQTSNPDGIT